jgi:hypothetical protein
MKKWNLRIVADDKRVEFTQTDDKWTLGMIMDYAKQQVEKLQADGKIVTKVMLRYE